MQRVMLSWRAAMAVLLVALLATPPLEAWNRKGDRLYKQGREAEIRKEWEKALEFYEQAVLEDPSHVAYLMAARRVRFQAAQQRVNIGQRLRDEGKVQEALVEFQKAYSIDPSSTIAYQEIERTLEMLRKQEQGGIKPEEKGLTAAEKEKKESEEKIDSMLPVPALQPISRQPIRLKMSNQPPRILYETIAKLAGINVIFDTDFQAAGRFTVDLQNESLEEALDIVSVQTKSFWKPLSENTIFVTQDNVTKRRDYEDVVVKTFYLNNITSVQELQEISTAVRAVTEVRRLFVYNGQYVIIIRGTVDQVALAEKLIADLDKPKAEVVVDVVVMELSRTAGRDLAATLTSGGTPGIDVPVGFTPRNPILSGKSDGDSGGGGTPQSSAISLARIGKVSTNDFSITLPGAMFKALFSKREGRVLQSPQVRAVEGQKASLRLGDKIPFASGSYQPGLGAVGQGISPLISTQFQFAEVGVNVDLVPKVHGSDEVSLHIELELSTVRERIDIGGIEQPVIGQRKIIHDIRIREGEVNLLGGLQGLTNTSTNAGIPGLGQLPILKHLFSSQSSEKIETELMIALIPHIVRSPEIKPANLRGIAAGNDATVKLRYGPVESKEEPKQGDANTGQPAATAPAPGGQPQGPAEAKPPAVDRAPSATASPVQLQFQPAGANAKVNQQVYLVLQLNQGTNLFDATMRVKYDPKVLRMTEVIRGNVLSPDGQNITVQPVIQDGEATITLSRQPNTPGVDASGPLVLFKFQAVGAGTTQVTLPSFQLRNSSGQPIPASVPVASVVVEQ